MTKLTVEQLIQKDHVFLMKHPRYCLYSGIIMLGKVEVDDSDTASTNGRDVTYGRGFMSSLTPQERRAVILHENLHKAFRHLTMWKHLYDKEPQLANMACDYVINLMIYDSDPTGTDVKLPACGLFDEKFRGLDAGEVFRRLQKQRDEGKDSNKDSRTGDGIDTHDWDGAQDMTKEEHEQLARDVDQALRQGSILAGKLKGKVPREVAALTDPRVDWRDALRDFVTSFCNEREESTWRRPSRRWIGEDVYMPSMISESVGRMVVAVDTSGSIANEALGEFLSELQAICRTVRPEGIDLVYWDTRVRQHEKYSQDQLDGIMTSTKPKGGGGTSPQCIVNYIKDKNIKAECAVVLTDGYVSGWGTDWPCPVLWGITTNRVAGIGKSIHIK